MKLMLLSTSIVLLLMGNAYAEEDHSRSDIYQNGPLTWENYPEACISCHADRYDEMMGSVHYKLGGMTQDMVNAPSEFQGKLTNSMNSYCISIVGDWYVCGKCHVGRGKTPNGVNVGGEQSDGSDLDFGIVGRDNVDCLMCHSLEYANLRTRLPDDEFGKLPEFSLGVPESQRTLTMLTGVTKPVRGNCLKCHAFAGGGDGVKRGNLSMENVTNTDPRFDVHMNANTYSGAELACQTCHTYSGTDLACQACHTYSGEDLACQACHTYSGADLACQACHTFENHRVIGKGSDLRPTDDFSRGAEVNCGTCHPIPANGEGHLSHFYLKRHVVHVACQTCHIPSYAKFLDENGLPEEQEEGVGTEVHRDWAMHHDKEHGEPSFDADGVTTAFDGFTTNGHPSVDKAANLTPIYKWWNRLSDNYLVGDVIVDAYDSETDAYSTSRPLGGLDDYVNFANRDGKIYPFKYKSSHVPIATSGDCAGMLIPLNTYVYIAGSGDVNEAIRSGLVNMGCDENSNYEWVLSDTYQVINHGVEPSYKALGCSDCHDLKTGRSDRRIPFAKLGYHQWPAKVGGDCSLCHYSVATDIVGFMDLHYGHRVNSKISCQNCHSSEPTGLVKETSDLCNDCHVLRNAENFSTDHHSLHSTNGGLCTNCHTYEQAEGPYVSEQFRLN